MENLIAIDADQVLVDTWEIINTYYNINYRKNMPQLTMNDYTNTDLYKVWGCTPEQAVERIDKCIMEDFNRIGPRAYSQEAVKILAKNNDLVVVTTRPSHTKEKSKIQIHGLFPDCFGEIYFPNNGGSGDHKKVSKADFCKKIGAAYLIEDDMYHLQGLNRTKGFLFDFPWNQGELPENVTRIFEPHWENLLNKLNVKR